MPIYNYKCKECGYSWETFCKTIPKKEDKTCPNCGSNNTYKLFKDVYFHLDFTFSETGYDITHREMQRNKDESMFLEDEVKKQQKKGV